MRLFDLFNETAQKLADYLPQSGADLLVILKNIMALAGSIDVLVANNIGVDLRLILTAIGKLTVTLLVFLFDLIRNIVSRLQ